MPSLPASPSPRRDRETIARALRLYAISNCGCDLAEVRTAFEAGITFFQLREKELSHEAFLAKARAIRAFCPAEVPFIINDDIDIALAADADGVHIGPKDGSVAEARKRLGPGKILGVSARSVSQALDAEAAGADYLGVGAVFPTSTKNDAKPLARETLRAICASVRIPVVAIGGITAENLGALAGTGVKGVAVVSAVFGNGAVADAVRRLSDETRKMVAVAPERRVGAIIDLDGVVLDSLGVWKEIDSRYLADLGLADRPEVVYRMNHASTLMDAAVYLHDECGVAKDAGTICREFKDLLRSYYHDTLLLLPGAREALERFRREGIRTALVTASPEEFVMPALRRNHADQYFDHFFFDTEKTDRSVFPHVIETMGTGIPETTVYDDLDRIRDTAEALGFATRPSLPSDR